MTAQRSHGDGRRMTVAEAAERRARMIRFHGSLELGHMHGQDHPSVGIDWTSIPDNAMPRAWNSWMCILCDNGVAANAVDATFDAAEKCIVAACPACRGAA